MARRGEASVSSAAKADVRSTARVVDYAAARTRRGYGGRTSGAAGARAGVDYRDAHRRHLVGCAGAPEPSAADRPADDAGKPDDPSLTARIAGAHARPPTGGGGRVARTHGDQAWRADGAGTGAPARHSAGSADLGAVSDVRQLR